MADARDVSRRLAELAAEAKALLEKIEELQKELGAGQMAGEMLSNRRPLQL